MTASLVFRQPAATSGRLVFFGVDDGGSTGPVIPPVDLTLDGYFPDPEFSCTLEYRSDTQRPLVASSQGTWQDAKHAPAGTAALMQDAEKHPTGWQALWSKAANAGLPLRMRQPKVLQPDRRGTAALYQLAQRLHEAGSVDSQSGLPQHVWGLAAYEVALPDRLLVGFRHQDGLQDRRPQHTSRVQVALPWLVGLGTDFQKAAPSPVFWVTRYQPAMQPLVGISVPGEGGPVIPPKDPPCYMPDPHLVFRELAALDGRLVFLCERHGPGPANGVVVPVRRVYIVLNNITLHRVDTGAELRAHSFGMSLDYQSWTWSWQATLHNDAAAHLGRDSQGDPAELAVMVNGQQFRLRLERVTRDRRFNPTRWSVSGKGKASILSAPYAPAMPFGNPSAARTAQQLMQDALTINGVGIGWSVDWGLQDWLVPAGAWAMQGSYIDAINDIAAAAGGYVQPHPTDSVLRILPRYPAAPWDWGSISPDFEIPADAAEVEGTEYIDQPAYNRVFVGGVGAGVFGPFTRAGTAGDVIAPQVTHALITDAVVHRQRGVAELSNTGRQEHVTLNMQVLPETGVIVPGKFVRYLGDRPVMGIVRSTSIDWSFPKLRQTIKLETHA